MKLSAFTEGLQILSRYFDDRDGYHIGAEHDQFFVYATSRPVSADDVIRLAAMGWFQPDCGWNGPADYKPEEGWSAFT
jgi:hypothetical protein